MRAAPLSGNLDGEAGPLPTKVDAFARQRAEAGMARRPTWRQPPDGEADAMTAGSTVCLVLRWECRGHERTKCGDRARLAQVVREKGGGRRCGPHRRRW